MRSRELKFRDPVLNSAFGSKRFRSESYKIKRKRYRSTDDIAFGTAGVMGGTTMLGLSLTFLERFEPALGDLKYVLPAAGALALGLGLNLLRGKK